MIALLMALIVKKMCAIKHRLININKFVESLVYPSSSFTVDQKTKLELQVSDISGFLEEFEGRRSEIEQDSKYLVAKLAQRGLLCFMVFFCGNKRDSW